MVLQPPGLDTVTLSLDGCMTVPDALMYCDSIEKIILGKDFGRELSPGFGWSYQYYAFKYCKNLKEISVDVSNTYYTSDGGVLYNKDMTELLCYPRHKNEVTFHVPASVLMVDLHEFEGEDKINIVMGNEFTEILRNGYTQEFKEKYTIYGYAGTQVETYANAIGIPFKLIGTEPTPTTEPRPTAIPTPTTEPTPTATPTPTTEPTPTVTPTPTTEPTVTPTPTTSPDIPITPSTPTPTPSTGDYKLIEKEDNKFIKGIGAYTNWLDVKGKFTGYTSLFAKRANGTDLNDDDKVGTGTKITINDKTYTAVIPGDLTGEGRLNVSDLIKAINLRYKTPRDDAAWDNGVREASLVSSSNWENETRYTSISDIIKLINMIYKPIE